MRPAVATVTSPVGNRQEGPLTPLFPSLSKSLRTTESLDRVVQAPIPLLRRSFHAVSQGAAVCGIPNATGRLRRHGLLLGLRLVVSPRMAVVPVTPAGGRRGRAACTRCRRAARSRLGGSYDRVWRIAGGCLSTRG